MSLFGNLFKPTPGVTSPPVTLVLPLPEIPPPLITAADAGVVTAPQAPKDVQMTDPTNPVSTALANIPKAVQAVEKFAAGTATSAASFADLGTLTGALHTLNIHPEFKVTKMTFGEVVLDGDLKVLGDSVTVGSVTLTVRIGH